MDNKLIIDNQVMNTIDMTYGMLVNKAVHYHAEDYEKFEYIPIITTYNCEVLIERTTYSQFKKLQSRMETENVTIGIMNALRNEAEQANIYKHFIQIYGQERADKLVAPVGTSEHHTGLALDIQVYADGRWLDNHADFAIAEPILGKVHPLLAEYGFILRYPKGGEEITTISYEPWHIRYVGKALAEYLYNNHLLLEDIYLP